MTDLIDTIQLGDCLDIMPSIPDKSIDAIICDPPYGQLSRSNASAKWDSIIPFEPMWAQLERIIKDNGAIVLFGQGLFTARLMMSNPKLWRYNLVWKKGNRTSGFLNANRMPLRNHEDICVFYKKLPTYNPQMEWGEKSHPRGVGNHKHTQRCYGGFKDLPLTEPTNWKYPKSVINFERDYDKILHPTQKPINLMSWLIRTYTNSGGVILDFCAGSGSTLVAAVRENRHFIGIEKEKEYYDIACKRIKDEINDKKQRLDWI